MAPHVRRGGPDLDLGVRDDADYLDGLDDDAVLRLPVHLDEREEQAVLAFVDHLVARRA